MRNRFSNCGNNPNHHSQGVRRLPSYINTTEVVPVEGVQGKDGKDGYTPIKGVDYFDGEKGDKGSDGKTFGADGIGTLAQRPTTVPTLVDDSDREYRYFTTDNGKYYAGVQGSTTWVEIPTVAGANGKTIENYSNTVAYSLGSQVFFNGTEIYEAISATVAGESPITTPAKWNLRLSGAEYYREVKRFKDLSEGYLVDDNFDNNDNGWIGTSGQVPPFTIIGGELTITLDVTNTNRSVNMPKIFNVGQTYPVEVRVKRIGAQQRVVIGTNISPTAGTTHHFISDLTDDYKVYNFNITPTSGFNSRLLIGVISNQNLGGSIVVDYIKVGTQAITSFNLQAMQVLNDLNKVNKSLPNLNVLKFKQDKEKEDKFVKSYDYGIVNSNSGGLDLSQYFDLSSNWDSFLYTPVRLVTAAQTQLFDENFTLLATLPYKTDKDYLEIKKSDYPTARFINLYADNSFKDYFIFAVSYAKNKHQVDAEISQSDYDKVRGLEVNYLDYDNDFPNIGAWTNGGMLNSGSYPTYRATNKLDLPQDWFAIEYDAVHSSSLGLCFFAADGEYLHAEVYSGTSFKKRLIFRSDIPDGARYYAYSKGTTGIVWERKRYFKIYRKPIAYNLHKETYESKVQRSKIFNPDVTDLTTWNTLNPSALITEDVVISADDFAGRNQVRIPPIVITNAGTTLISSEIRVQNDDLGVIDIGISRKTSSESTYTSSVVYADNPATYGRGMNPSLVVDRTGVHGVVGRIYLCILTTTDYTKGAWSTTRESNNCILMHSDDDGVTWSTPVSLKDKWPSDAQYTGFFPCPHAGIQLTNGMLVIPTMIVITKTWRSGILYKAVGGDWVFSKETTRPQDNECTVLEYEPNKVLINCRVDQANTWGKRRVYSYDFTKDKWDTHAADLTYSSQGSNCQMSECKMVISSVTYFVRTHVDPYYKVSDRRRITLWVSRDYISWTRQHILHLPASRGYSGVAYHNNKLVVCYEHGDQDSKTIRAQDVSKMITEITTKTRYILEMSRDEWQNRLLYLTKGWGG